MPCQDHSGSTSRTASLELFLLTWNFIKTCRLSTIILKSDSVLCWVEVSDIPVSCGISHPGACTQMEDCLLLRVSLSSALPGPSSCSQGCRAIPRLLCPTASEHRPLGISLPFSVGLAAHSPLGTVTKGNTSQ